MTLSNVFHFDYQQHGFKFSEYIYYISSYHYNWHPEVEVLVVLSGRVELTYDSQVSLLDTDDVVVLPPNCGHATLALEEETKAMVLHIDSNFIERYIPNFKSYSFTLESDEVTRDNSLFTSIRQQMAALMLLETEGETSLKELQIEFCFMSLVSVLLPEIGKRKEMKKSIKLADETNAVFNKMITYIDRHYKEKIELEELAKIGGYNPSYTSQFFKRQLGISFKEYLSRLRLREAAVELVNSNALIVTIANECGFTDVKAFNTAFRKHFHKTPSDYRKYLGVSHKPTVVHNWKEYINKDNQSCLACLYNYVGKNKDEILSSKEKLDKTLLDEVAQSLESLVQRIKQG